MELRPGGHLVLDAVRPAEDVLGGRWALGELLGTGSTSIVRRAVDTADGAVVAVKELRPELAGEQTLVARLVREHAVLRSLDHPRVLRALDLHRSNRVAIILELLPAGDLAARLLREQTLTPREAVRTTCAVLDALEHVHTRGIAHGDVKAANVLLGRRGRVVLGDLGSVTGTGGTPEHLAPELVGGCTASPAGDVYATGALLHQLLVGRTPFAGRTPLAGEWDGGAVLDRQLRPTAPPPDGLPVGVQQVLRALLDRDPRRRPTAAAALTLLRALPRLRTARRLPLQPAPAGWDTGGWTPDGALDPARTLS